MIARRRAERAVEEARKKVPSIDQARDRTEKDLKADLERAKADERAKKAAYDREKAAGMGLVW